MMSDENMKMETKENALSSQEEKEILNKIYGALSDAGYIRANFNGLTPFDKIAGGLMWCITGSDNLVNIGLLFGYGEELNIKKKILLSERIIKALLHTAKRCPLILQPHQIMGLDVDKIFGLVVWLIQQNYIFNNISYLPPKSVDALVSAITDQVSTDAIFLCNILNILDKYRPRRKFKHISLKDSDILDKCIYEYVNIAYIIKDSMFNYDQQKQYIQSHLVSVESIEYDGLSVEDITNQSHYDLLNEELHVTLALEDKSSAVKEIEKCEKIIGNLQVEYDSLYQEMDQDTSILENMKSVNREMESSLSFSDDQSSDEYQNVIAMVHETKNIRDEYSKLRSEYITKQERSKDRTELISEDDFCKQILSIEELNASIAELEEKLALEDIEISELEKLLDQPGPAELTMYQKRFYELYDQIAANTIETRQFYDLHNTLIDTKHYIEKEINLLNSVLDNYSRAMSSANYREQFFSQLESIVDWVNQTRVKINQIYSSKKEARDGLHQQWLTLMELEREYALVVSQLNSAATPERVLKNA